MIVNIFFLDDRCVTLPVLCCLFREKIVLIGKGPPYVSVCTDSGNEIFPVKIIALRTHLAESPAVIWMHYNDICLDSKIHQFFHTVINVLEMFYVESLVIEVIAFCTANIFLEILRCQYRTVHRSSFIWIADRLVQVIIIVFREYTETDLVECTICQCLQCLFLKFLALKFPYIAGCSDRIVWFSIFICHMVSVGYTNRAVVSLCCRCYMECTCIHLLRKASFDFKCIIAFKRWHETYAIDSVSIIKTVYCFCLFFAFKGSLNCIIRKRIALVFTWHLCFKSSPLFHRFCIFTSTHNSPSFFL